MRPLPETFDRFYAPLVGNEELVEELKDGLAQAVRTVDPTDFLATDPYARLQTGILDLIDRSTQELSLPQGLMRLALSAMRQTVAVVRCVGDTYTKRAKTPQNTVNVERNTDRALLRLYAIAFADSRTGSTNLPSYFRGRHPNNPLLLFENRQQRKSRYFESDKISMSARALKVKKDADGQLDMRPRFKRQMSKVMHGKCPATETKVGPPGRQQTALWKLMSTVSEVAVTEIFPHYFTIVDDAEKDD